MMERVENKKSLAATFAIELAKKGQTMESLVSYREPAKPKEEKINLDYEPNLFQKIFGCRKKKIHTKSQIIEFRYIKRWTSPLVDARPPTGYETPTRIWYTTKGNYVGFSENQIYQAASLEELQHRGDFILQKLIEEIQDEKVIKERIYL